MKFEFDPKTRTYSLSITIGDKEPLSPEDMRTALHRAVSGATGQLVRQIEKDREAELTEILFWFEEGWL